MTGKRTKLATAPNLIALVWGFAEATLFFIVPDVGLSFLALRGKRVPWVACWAATVGAVFGGMLIYGLSVRNSVAVLNAIEHVPAVSDAMIQRVGSDLADHGLGALFLGPFMGTPYKIYAACAPVAGIGMVPLALVTVPSRLIRFVLVSFLVGRVSRRWPASWNPRGKLWLLCGVWIVFYSAFLSLMPH